MRTNCEPRKDAKGGKERVSGVGCRGMNQGKTEPLMNANLREFK